MQIEKDTTPMPKSAPRLVIAAAVAVLAAGCGVKGDPTLPEDKADNFPRTYPQGAVPSEDRPENIFVDRRR